MVHGRRGDDPPLCVGVPPCGGEGRGLQEYAGDIDEQTWEVMSEDWDAFLAERSTSPVV